MPSVSGQGGVPLHFIERNSFDVRSNVFRLSRPDAALEFVLLPMVHIGSPAYYAQVRRCLDACDVVIFEGVASRKAQMLALAQHLLRWRGRFGLIHQSEGIPLVELRSKLIHGDVTRGEFDAGWRTVPVGLRALLWFALPVYALYWSLAGTKDKLARALETEDLPSPEEVLAPDEHVEAFEDVVLTTRDAKLIEVIAQYYAEHRTDPVSVAIVYGALHMRGVVRFLVGTLGYHVRSAEWITIFPL